MSTAMLARTTMRFGTRLGITALVLIVLGPIINRNVGVGDSLSFMPLPAVWESAPVAVLVSLTYLMLLVLCVVLSAILITASLVVRHAEASEQATARENMPSAPH
jgi:SNF family Na+-dependent transporter